MAKEEREIKQWITINGKHVPIFEGESKADAVKRSIGGTKPSTPGSDKKNSVKEKERPSYGFKKHQIEEMPIPANTPENQYTKHRAKKREIRPGYSTDSYGEGWKDGMYIRHTDKYGGMVVSKGKVGDYRIGEEVQAHYWSDGYRKGTIVTAHIYPNKRVEYNVQFSDTLTGDLKSVDTRDMKKKKR